MRQLVIFSHFCAVLLLIWDLFYREIRKYVIICCFFLLPAFPKRLFSARLFASGSDISRYISSLYFAVQAGKLFCQEEDMCFAGRLGVRVLYWGSDIRL